VVGGLPPEFAQQDWSRISRWVDDSEAANDLILLVGDDADSSWSRQCLRHADEVIWFADAGAGLDAAAPPPASSGIRVRQTLLLAHSGDPRAPRGTARWLQRFAVDGHLHLRRNNDGDLARLARRLMGRANGLVFGGGGARGFAHLGVLKALEEAGIPIDHVGGCSIGAVMAAYAAFDLPAADVIDLARRAFSGNPTGDFNVFPVVSLIKGHKMRRAIDSAVHEAVGFDADLEDCWKPLFCIGSNYSRATEAVMSRGNLGRAVRASVSIPAALPPVIIDGDLIVDGGTFNNFPTDVMARQGVGHILGCDLMRDNLRKLDLENFPTGNELLFDRIRGRSKRRYRVPGLSSIILNVSILHSQSKLQASRSLTDVCFTPELGRIGMLDWKAFDRAVDAGYKYAIEHLETIPGTLRTQLTG
jgi:NTE family protein